MGDPLNDPPISKLLRENCRCEELEERCREKNAQLHEKENHIYTLQSHIEYLRQKLDRWIRRTKQAEAMLEERSTRQLAMRVPLTDEFTKDYQDLRIQRDELEKQVSSMKDVIYEKTKQLETERGIAVTLTGELAAARENFGKVEGRCLHLEMMIEKREREIDNLVEEAKALEKDKKSLINQLLRNANEYTSAVPTSQTGLSTPTAAFRSEDDSSKGKHRSSSKDRKNASMGWKKHSKSDPKHLRQFTINKEKSSYVVNKDGSIGGTQNQGNVEIMEETEVLQTYCTQDVDSSDACLPPHELNYYPNRKSATHRSPKVQRSECHSCQSALQEKDQIIEQLKEQIRSLEAAKGVGTAARKPEQLEKIKELEEQLSALKKEMEAKVAQLGESEERGRRLEKENKDVVGRMKDLTTRLTQLTVGKDEHGDVSPKPERQSSASGAESPAFRQNLGYTKDAQILANEEAPEIVGLQQKLVSLERALCESQIEVTEMKEKNKKLEEHLHKLGKASKKDQPQQKAAGFPQQLENLKHENEALRAQVAASDQAAESMKNEILDGRQRVQDLVQELDQRNIELEELRKQQRPAGEGANELRALKAENENLRARVKEASRSIEDKNAEIAALCDQKRNLEDELNKRIRDFTEQHASQQTPSVSEQMQAMTLQNDSLRAVLKERDKVIETLMCKTKKLEEAVEKAQSREAVQKVPAEPEEHTANTSVEEEKLQVENELRAQCAQLKARIDEKDSEIKDLQRLLAEAKEKQGRSARSQRDDQHSEIPMSTAKCSSSSDMHTASTKEEESQKTYEGAYSPSCKAAPGAAQTCQCLSWQIKERQWAAKEALMKEQKEMLEHQLRAAKARLDQMEKAMGHSASLPGTPCCGASDYPPPTSQDHAREVRTPEILTAQSASRREATPPTSLETAALESDPKHANEAECESRTCLFFRSGADEPYALQPSEFCWHSLTAAEVFKRFQPMLSNAFWVRKEPFVDRFKWILCQWTRLCFTETRRCLFRYNMRGAHKVYVCGSFFNWELALLMNRRNDGSWEAWIDLPVGRHEFRFIAEQGNWETSPEYSSCPNDFGTTNNFIIIQ